MAKFCGKCGAPIDEGIKFCTNCGAKLDMQTNAGEAQYNDLERTSEHVIQSLEGKSEKVPQKPKRKIGKTVLKFFLILFLLIIILAAGAVAVTYFGIYEIPFANQAMESFGIHTVAAQGQEKNQCGDNLTYTYSNGVLIISGTGPMWDFVDSLSQEVYENGNAPVPSEYYKKEWLSVSGEIESIIIKEGVTSIGIWAFADCENLKSVSLPNTLNVISQYAFGGCSKLESITLPENLTYIGVQSFCGCNNLTEISIPASVTHIESNAFDFCESLTAINVDAENPIFSSYDGLLLSNQGYTLQVSPCGKTDVQIPTPLWEIGKGAFAYSKISRIVIPQDVDTIGDHAFRQCESLKEIEIADSVLAIGEAAFYQCNNLTNVVLPCELNTIQRQSFASCENLHSVTIPKSVTHIENDAFMGCYSLTDVYYVGSELEWNRIIMDQSTLGEANPLDSAEIHFNYKD